jgi:hypothetical protein
MQNRQTRRGLRLLKVNRTGVLAVILVGSLFLLPPFSGLSGKAIEFSEDLFDGRPEETALFIGNSRTFYHDMPHMVRSIADSAGYSRKLHIAMEAKPGISLADHLKNPQTRDLIARRWDHIVLQVLSSEQYSSQTAGNAWQVAADLIKDIQVEGDNPVMFVTWRYTDQCVGNAGMPPSAVGLSPAGYPEMHLNIQQQHARLAALTGVDLVNVGLVWEALQDRPENFSLYDDCNHPSIYGSYLSALMFYSYFSGGDVTGVTFKPSGMSSESAEFLRQAVSRYFEGQKPV